MSMKDDITALKLQLETLSGKIGTGFPIAGSPDPYSRWPEESVIMTQIRKALDRVENHLTSRGINMEISSQVPSMQSLEAVKAEMIEMRKMFYGISVRMNMMDVKNIQVTDIASNTKSIEDIARSIEDARDDILKAAYDNLKEQKAKINTHRSDISNDDPSIKELDLRMELLAREMSSRKVPFKEAVTTSSIFTQPQRIMGLGGGRIPPKPPTQTSPTPPARPAKPANLQSKSNTKLGNGRVPPKPPAAKMFTHSVTPEVEKGADKKLRPTPPPKPGRGSSGSSGA